jgi:hypothetical protein
MQSAEHYRQKATELREETKAARIPMIKDQPRLIAKRAQLRVPDRTEFAK